MKDDGGPAFPHEGFEEDNDDDEIIAITYAAQSGMSLRDYFAAAAFSLLDVPDEIEIPRDVTIAEAIASRAYEVADAMLKERAKHDPA